RPDLRRSAAAAAVRDLHRAEAAQGQPAGARERHRRDRDQPPDRALRHQGDRCRRDQARRARVRRRVQDHRFDGARPGSIQRGRCHRRCVVDRAAAAVSWYRRAMTRLLIVAIVLATGAARADTPKPAPPAATGSIKGTVIFEGEAPDRKKLKRDTDPFCAKTEKLDEEVVVEHGKLRDALVRIKNGTAGTHPTPTTPIVIDQRECMYTPRVVGMMPGQKIEVRNSDGTFHNVRGMLVGKMLWNKPY